MIEDKVYKFGNDDLYRMLLLSLAHSKANSVVLNKIRASVQKIDEEEAFKKYEEIFEICMEEELEKAKTEE